MPVRIIIGFLLLVFSNQLYGQEQISPQQLVEELVASIAEGSDSELDFTTLTEDLLFLIENPLNINAAEVSDFEKLPFLTDFQVMSLLDYRKSHGSFLTKYELSLVSGFDQLTIQQLIPFVTFTQLQNEGGIELRKAIKYRRNELMTRVSGVMEQPDGYRQVSDSIRKIRPNDYYSGNRFRYYSRYKFSVKEQVQAGITLEKDPGEEFFKGTQHQGFDFYSAHLQISDIGIFKTVVVGDYVAQYGQGLVLGSYLNNSKTSLVMDIREKYTGLKKYASSDENQYFRGVGTTLSIGDLKISAFGSYKSRDANHENSDSTVVITSLQTSGIHATSAQLEDKYFLIETMAGGNIQYQFHQFRMGVTGVATWYNYPFAPGSQPEDKYQFSGYQNQNLGADFLWVYRSVYLFGEGAISANKGKAGLVGAILQLTPRISMSVLYRNYGIHFQTLYGNAFSESGKNQNEQGFYSGIQLLPLKKWKLSAYYDFYRFPMITSQADGPSKGQDYLIQADFVTSRDVTMYWRLKKETREGNSSASFPDIAPLELQSNWHFRYHINYNMIGSWHFKNRVEVSNYQNPGSKSEYGFLVYQDVICELSRLPVTLYFRYAVYQTDSYNTRIYTYESDVLNAFSVPALYDKGSRFYLLFQYHLTPEIDCWVRLSQTAFVHRNEIGSGPDRISGNHKSELKAQIRWRF